MWRFNQLQHRHSKGDTIVEVLISIAVVSTVLAGAFTVTQKSTQAVRDGQERSEALQILQGQVEQVRSKAAVATSSSDPLFNDGPQYFCMDSTGSRHDSPSLTTETLNDDTKYADQCKNIGDSHLYNIADTYDPTTNVFSFYATWDKIGGGIDTEQLNYRVYPGLEPPPAAVLPPGPGGSVDADIVSYSSVSGPGGGGSGPHVPCWQIRGWSDPYCWRITIVNKSNNPPGSLIKCTWQWKAGDPVVTYSGTATQCQYGKTAFHKYTPVGSGPPPEGYTVTLTNYATNGSVRTATYTVHVPY